MHCKDLTNRRNVKIKKGNLNEFFKDTMRYN